MGEIFGLGLGILVAGFLIFHFAEGLAGLIGAILEPVSRWTLKHVFGIDRPRAGADGLIGMRVQVLEDFTSDAESGQLIGYVALNGERWRARAADGIQGLASGASLKVAGRDGLVLLVAQPDSQ